jgi:hypothetical protein
MLYEGDSAIAGFIPTGDNYRSPVTLIFADSPEDQLLVNLFETFTKSTKLSGDQLRHKLRLFSVH